MPQLLNEEVSL